MKCPMKGDKKEKAEKKAEETKDDVK
jgi:hypothetical protein